MTGGQANFLQSLGWAVLNSLWQMALLWVIYQFITVIFRKTNPSIKSWLASSLLLGGFAWFVYTFITALTSNPDHTTVISSAVIGAESNQEVNDWLMQTLPVASGLYLLLLIIPVLHFIRNYRYVNVIRHYGLSKIHVEWRMFVNKVAAQMDIKKKVQIFVSEFVSSPVTIGFMKPMILVPLAAINHLTPHQLEAVLLHELSHIRRHDYLINLLINFVRTILYFNPFVKAFVKIVEREREKSCDEMVLQFQYESFDYASALLILERENHQQRLLALASGGNRNDLLHRVETIMGVDKKPLISFNKMAGLLAGLLCIISLNVLLILSKPVSRDDKATSFAHLSSPFGTLSNAVYETPDQQAIIEKKIGQNINNHIAITEKEAKDVKGVAEKMISQEDMANKAVKDAYTYVNYLVAPDLPELSKEEEKQVTKTLQDSRKVLENAQWKLLEKNIGEIFTEKEKAELKSTYRKEVDKFDWNKWENNLRMAYGKVDWEKINYQLENQIKQITIDSLHKVYNEALVKLSTVRKELAEEGLSGIPDTDITVTEVEQARKEAVKALNKLRGIRNKKIVHL